MSRSQLAIGGISTNLKYKEGDCFSLVNLRHKASGLEPVTPRKSVKDLGIRDLDSVFLHQVNEVERYIGIRVKETKTQIYAEGKSGTMSYVNTIGDVINGIEQHGYIISLVGNKDIYYMRYNSSAINDLEYVYLGYIPKTRVVEFFPDEYKFKKGFYSDFNLLNNMDKENWAERTKALCYNLIEENNKNDDYLFYDALIVRYAYRLYDGSLTKHSAPILIMPPYRCDKYAMAVFYSKNGDSIGNGGSHEDNKALVFLGGYNIGYIVKNIDREDYSRWEGVISSIDIFVSRPIGIANIEDIKKELVNWDYSSSGVQYEGHDVYLSDKTIQEQSDLVSNISNFYFFKSIDIYSDKSEEKNKLIENRSDYDRYKNILFQEEMTDDNMSNHKFGATCSYNYNKRLHLADIETTIFDGFDANYFFMNVEKEQSFSEQLWKNVGGRSISYSTKIGYNGVERTSGTSHCYPIKEGEVGATIIEVTIDTGSSINKIYTSSRYRMGLMFGQSMISYPDARATRIRMFCTERKVEELYLIFDSKLKKHNFLNLSYCLFNSLEQLSSRNTETSCEKNIVEYPLAPTMNLFPKTASDILYTDIQEIIDGGQKIVIREENKIKVSQTSNPMVFENKNTYLVSNGKILNMATNAMRVSEGQFGQYPLYVFTTKGIYAMNIGGGEVLYSNVDTPISFDVAISPVVCSTNNGVVFVSDRGVKFIGGGQEINILTLNIEADSSDLILPNKTNDSSLDLIESKKNLKDILYDIKNIAYDSKENEVIINIKDIDYKYVVEMNNGLIYQTSEQYDIVARNTYPSLIVLDDTTLKNYSMEGASTANVNMQLRPIRLVGTDMKELDRFVLKGIVDIATKLFIGCYSSLDEENYRLSRGGILRGKKFVDFRLQMMGNKARVYSFALTGKVNKGTRIDYLEYNVIKQYNDEKLR